MASTLARSVSSQRNNRHGNKSPRRSIVDRLPCKYKPLDNPRNALAKRSPAHIS
jgi:hypothetical protein